MNKKSSETSKSIFKNILYGFSTWILPLGLSFIATPILVKSLGNDDYGIYALILGFIGYSFNLNTGRAITKYIAEYRANGELHKINYVISATLFLNIFVGLIGVVSICLLANWLVTNVFLIKETAREKTIIAFYLSGAIIFVSMLNQVFNSILQGLQRFDLYSKIFNLNSFGILIGNIVLALMGYGLLALLIWNILILILTGIIGTIVSKKVLPEFKLIFTIKRDVLKLILKFSAGIVGYQILSNLLLLFERGWIIRKFGEENLTYYVVPMLLGIYIHSFIVSLLLVIFPLASELDKDREKLKKLYLQATKFVCFLVFFIAITLIIVSKLFLTLWMGPEFAEKSWLLLIIHIVTFSSLAILIVSWQMMEGLGHTLYNCIIFSGCLIITMTLMIYLTNDFGSIGVAIARLVGFCSLLLSIFYVENWIFKSVQIKFWIKIVSVIGLATLFAGLVEKYLLNTLSVSWVSLFVITTLGGLTYCFVLWALGFISNNEKMLLKNILSR